MGTSIALLLLLLSACGPDASPAEAGNAGIRCAEPRVEFGEVWEGSTLEHEFRLTTARDGVRVEGARADCGCTVAELQRLAPGSAGDGDRVAVDGSTPLPRGTVLLLGVSYDTQGKRGHAPRTVSLHTATGQVHLTLDATVRPWVELDPPQVNLPLAFQDEVQETLIRVASATGGRFRLVPTGRGIPDSIRVEAVPVGESPSAAWEARVSLGPGLPLGMRGFPIELRVEPTPDAPAGIWPDGDDRVLTVSPMVSVRVVGAVSLQPSSVAFGSLIPGETVARTLRLQAHDPEHSLGTPEFRIEGVRPADRALPEVATVSARAVPGENAWDLQILLSDYGGRFEGTFLGRLVVATGHPEQPEVEAAISGFLPLASSPNRGRGTDPSGPGG